MWVMKNAFVRPVSFYFYAIACCLFLITCQDQEAYKAKLSTYFFVCLFTAPFTKHDPTTDWTTEVLIRWRSDNTTTVRDGT